MAETLKLLASPASALILINTKHNGRFVKQNKNVREVVPCSLVQWFPTSFNLRGLLDVSKTVLRPSVYISVQHDLKLSEPALYSTEWHKGTGTGKDME
jgi:hypothetical protein